MIHAGYLTKGETNLSVKYPTPSLLKENKEKLSYFFKEKYKNKLEEKKLIFIQKQSHIIPK